LFAITVIFIVIVKRLKRFKRWEQKRSSEYTADSPEETVDE
jgi:hypothetical protein